MMNSKGISKRNAVLNEPGHILYQKKAWVKVTIKRIKQPLARSNDKFLLFPISVFLTLIVQLYLSLLLSK
jgi:hypothetical protein